MLTTHWFRIPSLKLARAGPLIRESRVASDSIGVKRRPLVFPTVGSAILALAALFGWIAYVEHLELWPAAAVFVSGLFAGLLTIQASSWLFGASPVFFTSATILLTARAASGGLDSVWFGFAIALGAAHALFAVRPCWSVLRHPKLRWWQSARRTPLQVRARVCPVTGGEFATSTSDISETGAFFTLDAAQVRVPRHTGVAQRNQSDPFSELQPNVHCSIRLELNQYTAFTCSARVVRREDLSRGTYRPGFGVVFVGLSGAQKRRLMKYLKAAADERAPAALKTHAIAA